MSLSRRDFLVRSSAVTAAFATLGHVGAGNSLGAMLQKANPETSGYGGLVPDLTGILDLPKGFRYSIISRVGDTMDDGLLVPGKPDGMATFPGPGGSTILIRNHEVLNDPTWGSAFGESNQLLSRVPADMIYDRGGGTKPCLGGTTTLVFNTRTQRLEKQHLSLAGTLYNCAGGRTPWGSWLTCEECAYTRGDPFEQDHGYVFEVPSLAPGLVKPLALRAMGRFRHEACGVNPENSIVYMTEDVDDSLIYRFIPNSPKVLSLGGRLQAMVALDSKSLDSRNWDAPDLVKPGASIRVGWVDIENVESPKDDLRLQGFAKGAIRFARGEGAWLGSEGFYFVCTTGGKARLGQIWRYRLPASPELEGTPDEAKSPGTLELVLEPNDTAAMANADNITIAPWGDLIICEDLVENKAGRRQHLLGITSRGEIYQLARNMIGDSEFAGCTFSPDGSTLFVNLQGNGLTLAVTGAWKKRLTRHPNAI